MLLGNEKCNKSLCFYGATGYGASLSLHPIHDDCNEARTAYRMTVKSLVTAVVRRPLRPRMSISALNCEKQTKGRYQVKKTSCVKNMYNLVAL